MPGPRELLICLLDYIKEQAKQINPAAYRLTIAKRFQCQRGDIAGLVSLQQAGSSPLETTEASISHHPEAHIMDTQAGVYALQVALAQALRLNKTAIAAATSVL